MSKYFIKKDIKMLWSIFLCFCNPIFKKYIKYNGIQFEFFRYFNILVGFLLFGLFFLLFDIITYYAGYIFIILGICMFCGVAIRLSFAALIGSFFLFIDVFSYPIYLSIVYAIFLFFIISFILALIVPIRKTDDTLCDYSTTKDIKMVWKIFLHFLMPISKRVIIYNNKKFEFSKLFYSWIGLLFMVSCLIFEMIGYNTVLTSYNIFLISLIVAVILPHLYINIQLGFVLAIGGALTLFYDLNYSIYLSIAFGICIFVVVNFILALILPIKRVDDTKKI